MGRASARIIDSLTWSLFMSLVIYVSVASLADARDVISIYLSLLIHALVFLCVDAHCFIFWDLPGDVLATPESALCGWRGVILRSLSVGCTFDSTV